MSENQPYVVQKGKAIFRHYFDSDIDPDFDQRNNLAFIGLIPLVVGFLLAFFALGINLPQGRFAASMTAVALGVGLFLTFVCIHMILSITGALYKNGIVNSVLLSVAVIAASVGYLLALVIGILGGFALSLGAYMLTPSFGVFMPVKVVLFSIPSFWWASKGWRILLEGEPVEFVFEGELDWLDSKKGQLTL